MKHKLKFISANVVLCICAAQLFYSCDRYHFTTPQPVDAQNIYEFPKKFRGTWIKGGDTITIGKDFYKNTSSNSEKVINGIWTDPSDTAMIHNRDTAEWKERTRVHYSYQSLRKVKYDSLKNPVDTVTNFILDKNKIYKIDNNLQLGYPFEIKNDTIYYQSRSNQEFELGRTIFLRSLTENLYILNIRDGGPLDKDGQWWQMVLLEKVANEKIYVRLLGDRIKTHPSKVLNQGDDYYFDSHWTKNDVLKLIQEGVFSDTTLNLDIKKKIH